MKIKLSLLLIIVNLASYAQHRDNGIDSLRDLISNDPNKIDLIQLQDQLGIEYMKVNFDSSLYFFEQAIELAKNIGNDTLTAQLFNNLGRIYTYIGITDQALKSTLKAAKIYEGKDMPLKLIRIYNNLGVIHYRNEDLEKSLKYYRMAEQQTEENKAALGERYNYSMGVILNNIGSVHDNMGNNDQALEVYFKALRLSKEYDHKLNMGNLYSNIGLAYKKNQQYDLALSNLKESVRVREQIGDLFGLSRSYMHLGAYFVESKKSIDSAIYYYERSVEIADKVGTPEVIINSAESLSELYKMSAKPSKALEYLSLHDYWEDSIENSDAKKLIAELELKHQYEVNQRQRELEQTKQEKNNFLILISLISVSIGSLLLVVLQRIKSKNTELKKGSLELSNKNLLLENKTLEQQLEFKNKELTTNVMYLMKKNELLSDVSNRLIDLKENLKKENTQPVQKIIFDLNSAKNDDTWEEFETRFQQVYNDFFERLLQKFPDLTLGEKKLCAFLRLDLTTKEISSITGQSLNGLNVSRARLRKKIGLKSEDSLTAFLSKI